MSTEDDDFLRELRATFTIEASEHLQTLATGVLELEKSATPEATRRLVEEVFRAAHSLKGAARAVDFTEIEARCQVLEDALAAWKRQEGTPTSEELETVHRILDAISGVMARPGATPASAPAPSTTPARIASSSAEPFVEDTVRIAVAKLDARLLDAEELVAAKLTTGQRVQDLRALGHRFDAWKREWTTVEPHARALRRAIGPSAPGRTDQPATPGLARLLEFFEWNVDHLKSLEGTVAALASTADQDRQMIGKLVDDLLEDSKKLLLLPFAALAAPFAKLVRDLCRDEGKEADLVVRGEEVEIDKRILEELKAPLIHLLRNSVDHGIETPDARRRLGKPSRGTITMAASRVNGNKVELTVSDDGAGIDAGKVKAAAVKRGLLPADEARQLDDAEAHRLIFETDVSTSPIITDLSGRGLGLAIVREKAEKLGGTVSVESRPGDGSQFAIVVPSTLATFRGILIEVSERLFVVPTVHVECVARVKAGEIRSVENRDTISLSGRAVALVRLADVLELPRADAEARAVAVVLVLGMGDQRIAFAVDAALDEQEVLVKPLRKPLSRVRNIAGATVLGSGHVAPILNVSDLLKSARKSPGAAVRAGARARPTDAGGKSVLVAEDSITSRMLIKGILESAGYRVKTAVNGMEAFTLLRTEKFDLVVSDVEMPRLNGFDLTARIRADKKLAELPVVLVTALETPEDRERGIDAGASAYIVKSQFDQSNLLDAVRRLA
jgi:two-component system chemotaxis sensor kinase CheA